MVRLERAKALPAELPKMESMKFNHLKLIEMKFCNHTDDFNCDYKIILFIYRFKKIGATFITLFVSLPLPITQFLIACRKLTKVDNKSIWFFKIFF